MTSWRPGNYRVANPQSGPIYPIGFCPLSAPPVISIWFLPYLSVYFISSPIFPILASAASLFYMTLPTFFLLFTHRRAIIFHPVFTSPYVSLLHPSCLLPSFLFLFLSCLFLLSWLCIYVTFIIILYYRMRVCIILVIN